MKKNEIIIELNNPNNPTILTKNSNYNNDNGSRLKYKNEYIKKKENICKRTTTIEKIIAISIAILTLVFIFLYIVGNKISSNKLLQFKIHNASENKEICYSFECIQSAANILNTMDQSIDPCDDFYNFACGNFIKINTIPDDKTSNHIFTQLDDILQEQLKMLIQVPDESDIRPFKLVKKFFQGCMNTTAIEEFGYDAVTKIAENLGGWPLLKGSSWDENPWNWENITLKSRKFGISVNSLFQFLVVVDVKNTTKKLIDLDEPGFGIEREYLVNGLNDQIVKYYYKYMVDIAVLFGASEQNAKRELKESLEFEIALAKICISSEERRNMTNLYNIMSIAELQLKYSFLNWLNLFNNLLYPIKVTDSEIINLSVPAYFKKLEMLLKKTPKRTIANYLLWRFYHFSVPFSVQKVRDRDSKFDAEVLGTKESEIRWKECLRKTRDSFPTAIGALYVRKYFDQHSRSSVMEMVEQIRNTFSNIITTVDWMDDLTKKAALLKLDNMIAFIGYPDELLDDQVVNNYYKHLEINNNSYLESILNISIFKYDLNYFKLRETVNRTDWERYSEAAIINAFYSPFDNIIHFPAGVLQNNFFTLNRPNYLNYGGIGFIIGHEITHGFDDQGRQFDLNGNLVDWWANDTKNSFYGKAQCFIEQYGNYVDQLTGLKLNGINTQGENIADNGGVKEAYLAYNNWVKSNGQESRLPGLQNFSSNQMFWISAAQNWCSLERPEYLKDTITTGVHPPPYFRVVGTMSNMKEFSKDFTCKNGARMNPIKKCQVW